MKKGLTGKRIHSECQLADEANEREAHPDATFFFTEVSVSLTRFQRLGTPQYPWANSRP